ncbi:hypothetical protein GQ600_18160 [Phytophthora cactorum]|nr:hypothetical protein GQ600_18160 [Phytophthora cactorum]
MLHWWDNRPVRMLCTGGSAELDRVVRREKSGEQTEVACPRVLKNYQMYMGGVDVHDHLRLQRCKAIGKPKISHIGFLKQLHLELCQLAERDWDTVRRTQGLRGLHQA